MAGSWSPTRRPAGSSIFSVRYEGPRRSQRFVLATKKNGFFALIDQELEEPLADLDGREFDSGFSENDLVDAINERLGIRQDSGRR